MNELEFGVLIYAVVILAGILFIYFSWRRK